MNIHDGSTRLERGGTVKLIKQGNKKKYDDRKIYFLLTSFTSVIVFK